MYSFIILLNSVGINKGKAEGASEMGTALASPEGFSAYQLQITKSLLCLIYPSCNNTIESLSSEMRAH